MDFNGMKQSMGMPPSAQVSNPSPQGPALPEAQDPQIVSKLGQVAMQLGPVELGTIILDALKAKNLPLDPASIPALLD